MEFCGRGLASLAWDSDFCPQRTLHPHQMWVARKFQWVSESSILFVSCILVPLWPIRVHPLGRTDGDDYVPLEGEIELGKNIALKELKIISYTVMTLLGTAVVHQDKQLQSGSSFFLIRFIALNFNENWFCKLLVSGITFSVWLSFHSKKLS